MNRKIILLAAAATILAAGGAAAQRAPVEITLNNAFIPDPQVVNLIAGGSRAIAGLIPNPPADCVGFTAPNNPEQVIITYNGISPLTFTLDSQADTTLMVIAVPRSGAAPIVDCDDDSGPGLNPSVTVPGGAGRYTVTAGTLGGGEAPAALFISEFGLTSQVGGIGGGAPAPAPTPSPAPGGGGPNPNLPGDFGGTTLPAGFLPDPFIVSVQAGGPIDANAALGGNCIGFIAAAPDFVLSYGAANFPLILSVASASDTTLVVNTPDGRWLCDDDGGNAGLNPQVRISSPAIGAYAIWVGSFTNQGGPAQLFVSEFSSQ